MEFITWLDELRRHDAPSVGEDAATLGELTAGGLVVADGYVLAASVLRRMLIGAGVDPSRLNADDGHDPAMLRRTLLDDPIDSCALAQLVAAYRHLEARTGLLAPAVVLRPSVLGLHAGADRGLCAPAEGVPSMITAVRAVWSSLFDAQSLADRRALRIAGAPSAAVLVQQHVPVLRSGTAFTRDPAQTARDVVFVAAAFGGGPDVWTGPPADTYRVDRSTHEIVQMRITAKEAQSVPASGTAPADGCHLRVLTDDEAASVTRTVLAVEDLLGGPQIVDFGLTPTGDVVVRAARSLGLARC